MNKQQLIKVFLMPLLLLFCDKGLVQQRFTQDYNW